MSQTAKAGLTCFDDEAWEDFDAEAHDAWVARALGAPTEHAHAYYQASMLTWHMVCQQVLLVRLMDELPGVRELPAGIVFDFVSLVASEGLGEGARIFAGMRRPLDVPPGMAPVGFTELREAMNRVLLDDTEEDAAFVEAAEETGCLYGMLGPMAEMRSQRACALHPTFAKNEALVEACVNEYLVRGAMAEFCLEWLMDAEA